MNRYHEPPTRAELAAEAWRDKLDALIEQANTRQWWTNHQNLYTLCYFLNENAQGIENILHAIEKPWSWTEEFILALDDDARDTEQRLDDVVTRALGSSVVTVASIVASDDIDERVDAIVDLLGGEEPVDEDALRGEDR